MHCQQKLALCFAVALCRTVVADSWDTFQRGGLLSIGGDDGTKLTTEWSAENGIRWRVDLAGYGQSSPVAHGKNVYVTSLTGEQKETLYLQALDRETGKELWRYKAQSHGPEANNQYVSRAAPTPVCDENGVIAFFEGGNLFAVTADGALRWERNLVADYGPIRARHGLAASLEQDGHRVFVSVERGESPYVLAIEKDTGKTIWKSDGLGATSWSSPRLIAVGDSQQLVLGGSGKLMGFDPVDGRRLWDFDEVSGNTVATPVPAGDGKFLVAASGRSQSNGDAVENSNGLLQIERLSDDQYRVRYVWRARRATSSFASPLAHDGHAYFVNRSGVVYCLDLSSGEEKFAKRLGESNWATPLGIGEHLYFFGKNGQTSVIATGAAYQRVASNSLWPGDGGSTTSVVYAAIILGNDLIMRCGDSLHCVSGE